MTLVPPTTLLARMVPMKPLLCVVSRHGSIGMALSDAYLGHGEPLSSSSHSSDGDNSIRHVLAEEIKKNHVGGVILGLPLRLPSTEESASTRLAMNQDRESLIATMISQSHNLPIALFDKRMSLEEAQSAAENEIEMWEEVDWNDKSLAKDATIALNHFLWLYTGGWRNTFG